MLLSKVTAEKQEKSREVYKAMSKTPLLEPLSTNGGSLEL